MMKAILQTAHDTISQSVTYADIEKPILGKKEVMIDAYASSVNPLDLKILKGNTMRNLPSMMGFDISGKVISVGEEVKNFKIGDEVYAYSDRQGSFAQNVVVREDILGLKPKNMNFEESASIALVSLTALQAFERADMKAGDRVLIHAGSGGVGSAAIQVAKAMGAYVYTTTSTQNVEWVQELGADHVIDYTTQDYETIVKDIDIVLDTLGDEYIEEAFGVIKHGGKILTIVGFTNEYVEKTTISKSKDLAFQERIFNLIELKGADYEFVYLRADAAQVDKITELIESNKLKATIEKTFTLEETAKALLHVDGGRTKGKVVIKIK